jgi:hypothetical protein
MFNVLMLNMTCLLLSLLLFWNGLDEGKMVKTKITKNITVSLPQPFRPMTDDEIADKYLTAKRPTAMYTNPDRVVDFGFNQTETRWRQSDLPMLKGVYKGSIAGLHGKVTFIQDKISTINDRDFIVFEFVSEVTDTDPEGKPRGGGAKRQYSYLQYTVQGGKILVFNFTCPAQLQAKWQPTAQAIMESIRIRS